MSEQDQMAFSGTTPARSFLVSGGTGFIGRRVIAALAKAGCDCRWLVRCPETSPGGICADLSSVPALTVACDGVDVVIHCAGHAHAFASRSGDEANLHWQVNYEGTKNLVTAAGRAGVKYFVNLSTVKAMAEPGQVCADENFPGAPETDYGQSKLAAEAAVLAEAKKHGMHAVNLRLSMVYGAGGRGNLERMGRLVRKGFFPPLPETRNRRSMVHVDDVVAAILAVATNTQAAGKTYIVTGPEAPSGRQLFDAMREVLGMSPSPYSIPEFLLQLAARCGDGLGALINRRMPLDSEALQRLLGFSWYDGTRIQIETGWKPRFSLREGLGEMLKS